MLPSIPTYGGTCLPIDSHIQCIVLATEETMTQVSHRPVKRQSWCGFKDVRRSTGHKMLTVRYSNQQITKSRQNPSQVQPTREHWKLIGVKTMSLFGYEVQFLCLDCCQCFRTWITRTEKIFWNAAQQTESSNACTAMHFFCMMRYPIRLCPIRLCATVSPLYRCGVRERRRGEAV